MSGKAARITLTETMYGILKQFANSRITPVSIAIRIQIVLLAFQRRTNAEISSTVGLSAQQVGIWRRRWQASYEALLVMQFGESAAAFERAVIDTLRDAPRSGSKGKFSAEQVVGILSIACEPPDQSNRPVTTWTGRELADEARKRSLVSSISSSQVNRFLALVNHQPHRNKYWCFTTEKDTEEFARQAKIVCRTYLDAPELYHSCNTHTVCVDEMTSLQANERRDETKLPLPGQVAKIECQYMRHGTVCVTGNWHVAQGQLIATTIDETRNNRNFADHILQTVQTDPEAGWVFVVDNLNTHCGTELVRCVAAQLGIVEDTLGKPKKDGILKTMKTRRAFLSDPTHRIRFVYLPKHSSWLNQVEVIFGIISRRVMRGGSFTSKTDLTEKIRGFIDYFNRTYAKPMNWTYNGRPTKTKADSRPKTWREIRQTARIAKKLALVTG